MLTWRYVLSKFNYLIAVNDMTETQLRKIFDKTSGHCHFCGDKLAFGGRGYSRKNHQGFWEVDHVIQRAKGGHKSADNCLPACTRCNRLRWHRTGKAMQRLLLLGVIAWTEITRKSELGKILSRLELARIKRNRSRRRS